MRTPAALLALMASLVVPAAAQAVSLPAFGTAMLSGAPSLAEPLPAPAGDSSTSSSAISADGRFVAFTSASDGLSADDDDRVVNVYVKDRSSGAVTLASRRTGADGEPAHADCVDPSLSDDGTRVAFACNGPLDGADTNATSDVYVRDLGSATTVLASRAGGGGPVGDDQSFQPSLSADGAFVAFASRAGNFGVPAVGNGGSRVYRRRLGGGNETILVSRRSTADGGQATRGHQPSLSDDGNRVAYTVVEGDGPPADPADGNGVADVYVRDVNGDVTRIASRASGGAGALGNGTSKAPALAGDGSAVAFESKATNFDFSADPQDDYDVYWRSLQSNTTTLVSVNVAGEKGRESTTPSIDRSGTVVAFRSEAVSLHPDDTDAAVDAYVANLTQNTVVVASRRDGASGAVANVGAEAVAVSGDGKKVAVALREGITPDGDRRLKSVIVRDLELGKTTSAARPPGNAPFRNLGGHAGPAVLSADGRFAAFSSEARGLGLPDDVASGVFVRDRVTGAVTLASRADGAAGTPFKGVSGRVAISADGRRVAFSVEGERSQVWVRDLADGRSFLASRADGAAAPGNGESFGPALDADGSRVAFTTFADNLMDGDDDRRPDVHVHDLPSGRTVLVSRADGAAGPKQDGFSGNADISADGNRVAFIAFSSNLGGPMPGVQAYVREIAAQTTRVVSSTPGGVKGDGSVQRVSIDASGTRIAFDSTSTNLGDPTPDRVKVFVRDLAADTLLLASRAGGPDGALADGDSFDPTISPDGGHVVFGSEAGNLAAGVPAGVQQVYRRDLAAGLTVLQSRSPGFAGSPSPRDAYAGAVSTGGGCVAFATDGSLVGPVSDYTQVYLRSDGADCGTPVYPPDTPPDETPVGGAGGDANGDGGGPGPAGGDARDLLAPVLSGVRLERRRFRAARGTVLRFRSSEAATLTLKVERVTRRGKRRVGTVTRSVRAGAGRLRLTARVGRGRLRPGRHRLTLTAVDAAGNRSRAVRLTFAVARRGR